MGRVRGPLGHDAPCSEGLGRRPPPSSRPPWSLVERGRSSTSCIAPVAGESLNGLVLLGRRTSSRPSLPEVQGVALLAALCSAVGAALSTSLQHEQAGAAPSLVGSPASLLVHLARRPLWIAAQLISVASFCLHTVALRYGSLALVQPVVVSGMVLAVPVRAALAKRPPGLDELLPVLLTGSGLTVFVLASGSVSAHPAEPGSPDPAARVFTCAGLGVAAFTYYAGCRSGRWRASLLGLAAGILFGIAAGLLKLVLGELATTGVGAVLATWPTGALLVAGIGGSAVNQSAYRAGRLSASMPLLNVADVLVALAFGVAVLGEVPTHSPTAVVVQCCALSCVAAGLWAHAHADLSARVRHQVTPATTSARGPVPDSRHGQQRAVRRTRGQRNARGR